MNARKCDRCGTYYDYYTYPTANWKRVNTLTLGSTDSSGDYMMHKNLDLCPNCMRSVVKWLHLERGVLE